MSTETPTMTVAEADAYVVRALREQFGDGFNEGRTLAALGADDLDRVELAMVFEDAVGGDVDEEEILLTMGMADLQVWFRDRLTQAGKVR